MSGGRQKRDNTNRRGRVTEQLKPNKKQMEPTDEENGDSLASMMVVKVMTDYFVNCQLSRTTFVTSKMTFTQLSPTSKEI